MKLKKALLVTGAATTIGLSSMAGVVSAQSGSTATDSDTGKTNLVDKIATKFNLNKEDVEAVFEEDRQAHEAEMQQRQTERLDQAVADGKITTEQKDKIVAKQKEVRTYMESLKDKADDERHTLMKQKLDEVKQWATDNSIPTEYMRIMGGGPGHGGPGVMMIKDKSSTEQ